MLQGKVIVITGRAGLRGRIFCRAVVESGGRCIVADLDEEIGKRTVENLNREFGAERAGYCRVEINNGASVEGLPNAAKQRLGRIDGLVNNA